MTELNSLIFVLRDKLNEIGIDHYDDRLAYRDLQSANDHINMIADQLDMDIDDSVSFATYKVNRCLVNVATYNAYRTYTRLAERKDGTLPSASDLTIAYDVKDAKTCLTLLFGTPFNDELVPLMVLHDEKPLGLIMGNSIINP